MTKETVERELQGITDKIVREFRPEKVVLFGSLAWGEPHKDSDIDLFVVKETNLPSLKRIEVLDRLFSRRAYPMDFLVYTPAQVQRCLASGDLFVRNVVANGRVLYDANAQRRAERP